MSKEINLMNRIIIGAILHGGDAGGPYLCDVNEVVPYVKSWLREKEYDKEYKVSNTNWCIIVPIDYNDNEEDVEDLVNTIYAKIKPDWEETF